MKKKLIFSAVGLIVIVVLIVVAFFVFGTNKLNKSDVNAIEVDKDGRIEAIAVEMLDENYYDENELKKTINDSIDEYNASSGKDKELVKLERFKIKKMDEGRQARVTISYETAADYAAFNQVPLFYGTLEQAITAGYMKPGVMQTVSKDTTETYFDMMFGSSSYYVIVFKEPLRILTPGNILFTSSDITVTDTNDAEITDIKEKISAESQLDSYAYILYK